MRGDNLRQRLVLRATGVLVGAGLVSSVGVAGVAGTPGIASAVDVACLPSVADVDQAVETAQACGADVEITSLRTEWDTVYASAEGGTRVDTSIGAVRTKVNGGWSAIDTSIRPAESGQLEVAAPALPISFSGGAPGEPLATIERDGHVLEFDVPFELTEPVVDGDQVTYAEVLPGVDLIASVDPDGTGFSEVLRVASPQAAANPVLAELDFPVMVSEGLAVTPSEGGFTATDTAGEAVFTSPAPLMWDSGTVAGAVDGEPAAAGTLSSTDGLGDGTGGEQSDGLSVDGVEIDPSRAPAQDSAVAQMPVELTTDTVTVTPDAGLLSDPETVWPVFIDPSVSGNLHEWTAIRSSISSDYKFSGSQGVGFCDVSLQSTCGEDFKSRLVWEFHDVGGGVIQPLDPSDLVSATFRAYGTHSWNCNEYGVRAYMVENIASGTTWSSNSGWTDANRQDTQSVAHRSSCSSSSLQPRWIYWDVMKAAEHLADEGGYLSIGLRAGYEDRMSRWKRYRGYDAALSIEYNQAPKKPWNLEVQASGDNEPLACGSSTWMRDATPIMRANIGDPDGDKVHHDFNVKTSGGVMAYNGPTSGLSYENGSRVSRTVPSGSALGTGSYEFLVGSRDTSGRWGPRASCSFKIDVTRPNTPTVTPVAGQPAVYEPDVETGGIGVEGKFAIGNNGSSDVTYFKYSWNDAENLDKTLSGSSGTISFQPEISGPNTLRVQSVDRAGNTSDVRTYKIDVAPPREDAAWELNEGSGATGADFLQRQDLELSNTGMWIDGPFTQWQPDRKALLFDAASDTAATLGPVVRTDGNFVVGAHVRLDMLGSYATAVSQDGSQNSGFKLGYAQPSGCPGSAPDGCWRFTMPTSDGGSLVSAHSDFQVEAGKWMYLVGYYDQDAAEIALKVCDPDPLDDDPFDGQEPDQFDTVTTAFTTPWFAKGAFQVGRGKHLGAHDQHWPGAVDNVRVWDGQKLDEDDAKIRRVCEGAVMVSTVPREDPNDPTEP